MMSDLVIRRAARADAATIFELIKALAVYEKAPHEVKSSVADIERDGFGGNPIFTCELAEWRGKSAGMALYFLKWSTWTGRPTLHLEDLFVLPEYRGKGIGLALLKHLAKVAHENNYLRMEWSVLDWNQPARDFYHRIGANNMVEWLSYRLDGDAIGDLAEGG